MSDNIPPEIITAILLRLPVKSLLRFRCVSKPWRSLIDDQHFIKHHLHHSVKTNSNNTLLVKSTEIFLVDLDSLNRLEIRNPRINSYRVAASCNGLVLLVCHFEDVVLWNPSTRKLNKLPDAPLPPEYLKLIDKKYSQESYGLGYDSEHDDYKVVRVLQSIESDNGVSLFSEVIVYSLKLNSWKKVENFPYSLPTTHTWGGYLNNALHTVVQRNYASGGEVIMAFDLANERHYEVPKPAFCGGVSHRLDPVVMGGCLMAVVYGDMNGSEIWVMREYGVKGSWCKLLHFEPPIPEAYVLAWPLVYSKNSDEVLLLNCDEKYLGWYDLREKTVTDFQVEGLSGDSLEVSDIHETLQARVCVASLVSPHSPGGGVGIEGQTARLGDKDNEIKRKRLS